MKQPIKLNEYQLRNLIKESVKKVLKERHLDGIRWVADEDDWTVVNEPKQGDIAYGVKLWCGSGYSLDLFKAYSEPHDYEGALEKVVAYLDQTGNNSCFVDDAVKEDSKNFIDEDGELDTEAFDNEVDKYAICIDATVDGASRIHYILRENLFVAEWPENYGEINEGFVNNLAQGAKSFFGNGDAGKKTSGKIRQNGGLNLGKRFNAAKTNYQMTKEGGKINDVIQFLEDMVAKKQLTPQTTIADLIGGKLNGNKYGRLHAMRDNRTSRASRAQNDIYRQ